MKPTHLLCALIAGLAFGTAMATPALTPPVATKIIHPSNLPRSCENTTVQIKFVLDENGVPHDIAPATPIAPAVAAELLPTLAKWRFTPAYRDGHPVRVNVIMPLRLVDEAKSRLSFIGRGAGIVHAGV